MARRTIEIARVDGDGSGPELFAIACPLIVKAASMDDIDIAWVSAPMGWSALRDHHDSCPESSVEICKRCQIVYFGGVGTKRDDETFGKKFPEMKPERRALLRLRQELNLSVNIRVIDVPTPNGIIHQHWLRFLLEDGYMGTKVLRDRMYNVHPRGVSTEHVRAVADAIIAKLGIKLLEEINGNEVIVTELSYFSKDRVQSYARYGFRYALERNLPVLNLHKANILARSRLWADVIRRVHKEPMFVNIPYREAYIDAALAWLFQPEKLAGVIFAGNEHGDIGTDAASGIVSLGEMKSASVNPEGSEALFESGAGTACDIAGQGIANPVGRILTGALLLRHIGATKGANALERAVAATKAAGWRTKDTFKNEKVEYLANTERMGAEIDGRLSPA